MITCLVLKLGYSRVKLTVCTINIFKKEYIIMLVIEKEIYSKGFALGMAVIDLEIRHWSFNFNMCFATNWRTCKTARLKIFSYYRKIFDVDIIGTFKQEGMTIMQLPCPKAFLLLTSCVFQTCTDLYKPSAITFYQPGTTSFTTKKCSSPPTTMFQFFPYIHMETIPQLDWSRLIVSE